MAWKALLKCARRAAKRLFSAEFQSEQMREEDTVGDESAAAARFLILSIRCCLNTAGDSVTIIRLVMAHSSSSMISASLSVTVVISGNILVVSKSVTVVDVSGSIIVVASRNPIGVHVSRHGSVTDFSVHDEEADDSEVLLVAVSASVVVSAFKCSSSSSRLSRLAFECFVNAANTTQLLHFNRPPALSISLKHAETASLRLCQLLLLRVLSLLPTPLEKEEEKVFLLLLFLPLESLFLLTLLKVHLFSNFRRALASLFPSPPVISRHVRKER